MTYYGRPNPTRKNQYDAYLNKWARIRNLMPKRMYMLMFMIDGYDDCPPWVPLTYRDQKRGGKGFALINCEGGFGHDAVVRKMIRDGEVTLFRRKGYESSFRTAIGGYYTINRTEVHVTDKGREVYAAWKHKNGERIGL